MLISSPQWCARFTLPLVGLLLSILAPLEACTAANQLQSKSTTTPGPTPCSAAAAASRTEVWGFSQASVSPGSGPTFWGFSEASAPRTAGPTFWGFTVVAGERATGPTFWGFSAQPEDQVARSERASCVPQPPIARSR
jgi:hypothetical protein